MSAFHALRGRIRNYTCIWTKKALFKIVYLCGIGDWDHPGLEDLVGMIRFGGEDDLNIELNTIAHVEECGNNEWSQDDQAEDKVKLT
jgi:hypothetical protein